MPGAPWITSAWLSEILYLGAFKLVGWVGPVILAALSVAAIAYGRIVLDEWRTRRTRRLRVKAYNDGHRRSRPASAEVTIE